MIRATLPPRDYLLQCFRYEPDTGNLISLHRPDNHFLNAHVAAIWNSKCAGKIRGVPEKEGYLIVNLDSQKYRVHRLIWMMVYGVDPGEDVDHENRVKSDNKLLNLRSCTHQQNCNNVGMRPNNTSGIKGVGLFKGRWRARIKIDGKSIHLGVFDDKQDAAAAFRSAATKYHGDFASFN